jgi:hypothetical protein
VGMQAPLARLQDSLRFVTVPSTYSHWELFSSRLVVTDVINCKNRSAVTGSHPLQTGRLSMVPKQAAEHSPEQR